MKDKASGETREVHARYVVVADGSLSRFGRRSEPPATSRTRRASPSAATSSSLSADPWIESCLDVHDRDGRSLPGYGWIFPLGDGTINLGIGLLSTYEGYRDVNTTHLMSEWAATAPERWGIDPDAMLAPPTGGRLPMAGSVNPKVGPNWLVVGDAAGSINPFNGEGIDYGTRPPAWPPTSSTRRSSPGPASHCSATTMLDDEYGLYFKVARSFARIIGQPVLMRELARRWACGRRASWSGCCGSWPTCCATTSWGRPRAAYRSVARIARLAARPRRRRRRIASLEANRLIRQL